MAQRIDTDANGKAFEPGKELLRTLVLTSEAETPRSAIAEAIVVPEIATHRLAGLSPTQLQFVRSRRRHTKV
jgi:hypothetical protein